MPRPSRGGGGGAESRATLISKSLSRLLRHAAVQERVPIDSLGYVRVDQLLAWQGLKKFKPAVEMEEVVQAVRESDKGRFGLRWEGKGVEREEGEAEGKELESDTQRALRVFDAGEDREPKGFSVRANQGHSMAGVSSEGLLKVIGVDDVPETVVHGTFYGAWEAILKGGNVRAMGRNHVHFSTGPGVDVARGVVAGEEGSGDGKGKAEKGRLGKLMAEAGVVSGMRKDAEVLIYVDVKRALAKGMKWWRSENGVVLTDGVLPQSRPQASQDGDQKDEVQSSQKQDEVSGDGVSQEFWTEVVEVKEGLGTLWRDGKVVQELPERLRGRPLPMGKSKRGGRGGGGVSRGGADGGGGRGGGRGKGKDHDQRGGHRDRGLRKGAMAEGGDQGD